VEAKKPISRRDFLKMTGRVGLALGLGTGLGGLVGACRTTGEVSSTIATIADAQSSPSTTTTVAAEQGRELVIGVVSHKSGPLALFGRADEWWMRFAGSSVPKGILGGDRRLHPVVFAVEDSGSDEAVAARAATRLVTEAGADLIVCSGDGRLVNAVASSAETLGSPCLSSFHQWRPFVEAGKRAPGGERQWAFAHAVGLEDVLAEHLAMWSQVATNKKVGLVLQDDIVGRLWADPDYGAVPVASAEDYECHLPGLVSGSDEHDARINGLMEDKCDICCAVMPAQEFTVFRRRCAELGYQPKVFSAGGQALLFPQVVEALGLHARNLITESQWQPDWPYADSITGDTAQMLAEDYMSSTGEMWAPPLAQYALFEWAADVFGRTADLDDKQAIVDQVRTTRLSTCAGPVDLSGPVEADGLVSGKRPARNVCKAPVTGVQWVARGAFELRPDIVSNESWPEIATTGSVQQMVY